MITEAQGYAWEAFHQFCPELKCREDDKILITSAQAEVILRRMGWTPPSENRGTRRYYLAGPMTGLPEHNFPAFHAEAARLRALGYFVMNPAEIDHGPNPTWEACLKNDIPRLLTCDGVALMFGWEGSRGARLEYDIASALGMDVISSRSLR